MSRQGLGAGFSCQIHCVLCLNCCVVAEGDLYFTVKLQNYTAVEKDEVILSCEVSKATGQVTWFKDGSEVFPSRNVLIQSDGKKRTLVIKKAAKSNMGAYTCDCSTDKTTAHLYIEGKTRGEPDPGQTFSAGIPPSSCLCPLRVCDEDDPNLVLLTLKV